MRIVTLKQIKEIIKSIDIIPHIEKGFEAYSQGQAILPPVGELLFKNPPGDVHIKYGYIVGDDYYVIKIASGFYENPKLQLPSSNGLVLLFCIKTGEILTIFLDEGYLTDLRTAAAGAIAAKYLAPSTIKNIGIIGVGTQAKLQLQFLRDVVQCRDVIVFGRDQNKLSAFQSEMQDLGFKITMTQTMEELTKNSNLIVTTTPAESPLLFAHQIQPGTHITAVGADSAHKQELAADIFAIADTVVADSISQCMERGDISHAIRKNIIGKDKLTELGNIIADNCTGRTTDQQITVADLTGLAVQDIKISSAIYQAILKTS